MLFAISYSKFQISNGKISSFSVRRRFVRASVAQNPFETSLIYHDDVPGASGEYTLLMLFRIFFFAFSAHSVHSYWMCGVHVHVHWR